MISIPHNRRGLNMGERLQVGPATTGTRIILAPLRALLFLHQFLKILCSEAQGSIYPEFARTYPICSVLMSFRVVLAIFQKSTFFRHPVLTLSCFLSKAKTMGDTTNDF